MNVPSVLHVVFNFLSFPCPLGGNRNLLGIEDCEHGWWFVECNFLRVIWVERNEKLSEEDNGVRRVAL